jgi:hypothetical protein
VTDDEEETQSLSGYCTEPTCSPEHSCDAVQRARSEHTFLALDAVADGLERPAKAVLVSEAASTIDRDGGASVPVP